MSHPGEQFSVVSLGWYLSDFLAMKMLAREHAWYSRSLWCGVICMWGWRLVLFVRRVAQASGHYLQVKKDEKELEVGFGQGPTFQLPVRGVQKTEDGTVKTVTVMLFGDRDNRRKVGHPQMLPCGDACDHGCHGSAILPCRVQRQVLNGRYSAEMLLHFISHGMRYSGPHQQHVCQPVEAVAHLSSTGGCSDCCARRRESSSTRP